MTPDDLRPGMYLVGRDDGTVEPFFVRVVGLRQDVAAKYQALTGSQPGYLELVHNADVTAHVERARDNPGWWWRRMTVGKLPSDRVLASMPSLYGWGGP